MTPPPAYVLPPPPPVALAIIQGEGLFPVHQIYCVGQNYAAHAREMGTDPKKSAPVFFTKPTHNLTPAALGPAAPGPNDPDGHSTIEVPYPPATINLHHEVELVVALGKGGRDIDPQDAASHIYGYSVGLDLTRRDLQNTARKAGMPWDMAKGFDFAAPCSAIQPADMMTHPLQGTIELAVNGERRQSALLTDLIWSVDEIIAALSRLVTLYPGDLIFTGTPDGVAAIEPGDKLEARIDDVGSLNAEIVPALK
ncbi:MAG: fumarylacetoacetate hydrolase family protein [Rhodospirillaceae bacterium]|nr:fumarylacetoacetate hydrolase family protein [Rhodospirillaceae bacterium]MBT5751712.1 fumarylacetoacetate hydrolase family protein [Rhodospirillaceae bacterium]